MTLKAAFKNDFLIGVAINRSQFFEQDQRVVESQRPEQVPFDLAEELHCQLAACYNDYDDAVFLPPENIDLLKPGECRITVEHIVQVKNALERLMDEAFAQEHRVE